MVVRTNNHVADLEYVRELVRSRAGVSLGHGKDYLVESRLRPLLADLGYSDLGELTDILRGSPDAALVDTVVDRMTTKETSWFRDAYVFDALRDWVFPELIETRSSERRLRIWCAACSTGQEPFSLAMLLEEHFPQLAGWEVSLLATDIAPSALDQAKAGRFNSVEMSRGLPDPLRDRYFEPDGTDWTVTRTIRESPRFERMNLVDSWPDLPQFDLILLRNVLMYFEPATRSRVLDRVTRVLGESGSLVLGGSETLPAECTVVRALRMDRAIVYRRARD